MQHLEECAHEFARGYVAWLKQRGVRFDRKMLRFNDVVAVGIHYVRCGRGETPEIVQAGIEEAVQACSPDFPEMYVPKRGPLTMIQPWMETTDAR